jgi:hypothetical protein
MFIGCFSVDRLSCHVDGLTVLSLHGQRATLPLRNHVPKGFGTSVPISLILQGKWLATLSTPKNEMLLKNWAKRTFARRVHR